MTSRAAGPPPRDGADPFAVCRASLVAVLAALDPIADPSAATVRLAALAWLVLRGLRQTACCMDVGAVPAVEGALGEAVDFEVRGIDAGFDQHWLSDAVVLYAAGARGALAPAWAEHRRAYSRGIELGRALGYFSPQERLAPAEAGRQIRLHHFASLPGGARVGLWMESVPPPSDGLDVSGLTAYVRALGLALGELDLVHDVSLEKNPAR